MKILVAAAFAASLLAVSGVANAMPTAPARGANPDVIQVAGGCGPGFYPAGPYGRCRPSRYERPVIVRPVPRGCPRGFFWRHGRCRPM
ncbi:GCG_CRPN prefix-to-repeats domain-containing protein [Bradyrhizobium sp. 2TAF24]|uniref:GCG_CRPN prefix-to-repeats domain-containing protein n=1 Tax=Bradyrhizobium sp. 2TAF24 TaxID=3233011 RepID=UPI003F907AC3